MAAPAHIARENGKKGGRPKGSVAKHTLLAAKGMELLVQMYYENVRPLNQALIDKALSGDIAAQKELRDRVHGKSIQPLTGADGGPIKFENVTGMNIKKE